MDGWIKLHRKLLDWQWYGVINVRLVFIHLLLSCNHKDKFAYGVKVCRGQILTSYEHLAGDVGITTMQLRKALDKLEKTGEINKQTTNKYTLITICNYDSYQCADDSEEQTNNKQITNKEQANNNQVTTNKNDKNEIKKENNLYIYKPTEFKNFFDSLNNLWRESAMMAIKVTSHTEFDKWIEDFINYAIATSDEPKSENQIKGHFINWVKQEKKNREKQKTQYPPQKNVAPCNSPEKYAMDISSRDFSQGFVKIPHNSKN